MDPDSSKKNSSHRFIETVKFLEARAKEINYFQNYLTTKGKNANKLVIQKLPKHMRRRAMSHNRYRIPSRVRKIAKEGLAKGVATPFKNRPRKTKRRILFKGKSDLAKLWLHNKQNKFRLLEHHKYLAKRCKMRIYEGLKVPDKANEKCYKTTYKFMMNNAVLIDQSYYCFLQFTGQIETVNKIKDFIKQYKFYCYIISMSDKHIQFLIDPLLKPDLQSCLPNIKTIEKSNDEMINNLVEQEEEETLYIHGNVFNSFCLIGDQIGKVLNGFLQRYKADIDLSLFNKHIPIKNFPPFYEQSIELTYESDKIIKEPFKKNEFDEERLNMLNESFYEFYSSFSTTGKEFNPMIDTTNNIIKETSAFIEKEEDMKQSTIDLSINHFFKSKKLPLYIKNVSTNELSCIIIIAPPSTGSFVISNLHKAGALLIGRKEKEYAFRQFNIPIFPKELVPSSLSFISYWERKINTTRLDFLNKKRQFNHFQNKFKYPFFGLIKQMIRKEYDKSKISTFRFEVFGKGSIKPSALLFIPLEEDLKAFEKVFKGKSFFENWLNNVELNKLEIKEEYNETVEESFSDIDNYCDKLDQGVTNKRKILGQTISAGFNCKLNKPAGVFIACNKDINETWENQQKNPLITRRPSQQKELYLLARNEESFHYYFIKVQFK